MLAGSKTTQSSKQVTHPPERSVISFHCKTFSWLFTSMLLFTFFFFFASAGFSALISQKVKCEITIWVKAYVVSAQLGVQSACWCSWISCSSSSLAAEATFGLTSVTFRSRRIMMRYFFYPPEIFCHEIATSIFPPHILLESAHFIKICKRNLSPPHDSNQLWWWWQFISMIIMSQCDSSCISSLENILLFLCSVWKTLRSSGRMIPHQRNSPHFT